MRRLGFRAKLTATISLLIACFAAFFSLYSPQQLASTADEGLEQRAVSVSGILANLAVSSVVAEDLGGAQMLATDLDMAGRSDDEIAYLAVVKPNGRLLASYVATGVDKAPTFTATDARRTQRTTAYLEVSVPLIHEEQNVGTLITGFSRDSVAAVRSASQRTALLVSTLIFAVGLIAAWFISRGISGPLLGAARELDAVSMELVATARQQEASTAEEAAAVAETRRSMDLLLESAQQIADQSGDVLGNAEQSVNGSQQIAARIHDLNDRAEKVTEFLTTIMQIADKADLLALNASLEGTKAGEAGKGFALVAAEMRRLAENVMESASEIRALVKEMRDASHAAVGASSEGAEFSKATTGSARQIARLTQDQRQATEQVIASMDQMQQVLKHTMESVQRSTSSARQLGMLAGRLSAVVNPASNKNGARRAALQPTTAVFDADDMQTSGHDAGTERG